MKNDLTELVFILDRSGSMSGLESDTIGGFNAMIEKQKKEADFKLTYEDDGQLYIVRGYGEQETGGYSIAVKEVYLTKNAICFHTMLIGPGEAEEKTKAPSYPYIVVQVKSQDKNVIFE